MSRKIVGMYRLCIEQKIILLHLHILYKKMIGFSLFGTGVLILIFIHLINSSSVSLVNAMEDVALSIDNTDEYKSAVDRSSSDRHIIPIQLESPETSEDEDRSDGNTSNIITAIGAIGGSIAGGFVTQRLAERIENKRIEARQKEKQAEREQKEKEKQAEREQIRKIVQIELTEYNNNLNQVLDRAKDLPIDDYSSQGIKFLSKNDWSTIIQPTTSYLQYPFEKRISALTVEEAAKVEKIYRTGLSIPSEWGNLFEDYGFQNAINPEKVRNMLEEVETALIELTKNN